MADNQKDIVRELEKRILWFREEVEELDPEELDELCALIEKLAPDEEPHMTKEEAYDNIMKRVDAGEVEIEDDDESRLFRNNRRKKARIGFQKAAMLVASVIFMVAATFFTLNEMAFAMEDKSLFTIIMEKVGALEIEKEEGEEASSMVSGEATEEFYDSWGDLNTEWKKKITVPEYIPEGYALYGIRHWNAINREILQADYYDKENGHLLFQITVWSDGVDHYKEVVMEEDENNLITECSDEKIMYYQYEDEYICLVFDDNVFYRISGNTTLEEMIKIREGVEKSGSNR